MAWTNRRFSKGALFFGDAALAAFAANTLTRSTSGFLGNTLDGVLLSLTTGIIPYTTEETGITVVGAVDQGMNAVATAVLGETDRAAARALIAPARASGGLVVYNAKEVNTGGQLEAEAKPLVFQADDASGQSFVVFKAYPNLQRGAQLTYRLRRPHVYGVVFQMIGVEAAGAQNAAANSLIAGLTASVRALCV